MLPLILSLFLLLPLPPQKPNPDVTVDAYTRVIQVGKQIRIRARINMDERNRSLTLEWYVEPGFENRKYFQVDGAQRQRTFEYFATLEEAGEWTVRAILKRSDDTQRVATTTVRVIGGFDDGQAF